MIFSYINFKKYTMFSKFNNFKKTKFKLTINNILKNIYLIKY